MKILLLMCFFLSHLCYAKSQADFTISDNETISTLYSEFDTILSKNFSETGNETVVKFRSKADYNKFSIYKISILLSKIGERRIYIFSPEPCKPSSSHTTVYIKTNKKNVSYNLFCNNTQQIMTPKDSQGTRYLMDLLNKEETVTLHFSGQQVTFDALGFSTAWLNFGGNAL
ncbi:hypothetical protein CGH72_08375 [Vibrio parahaemolyticus]|uniref:hypothetical protein n=1 Tax=Vibrio parahaemolyticus TaxID=670 RepID=UPI00111D34D9|nr:hypothetical protein [Vibrio parahaemolyticus]TOK04593.1 hypothetical protein CGI25_22215 [Vibrio parahaemolyticus]TOM57096.1 hypothetical protein CGH75_14790 [Vibrio parahaemolyticus]TOM64799.1 hypothetical protein CGH73_20805 [Vibrio parahaemolyticus]TOM73523.1 hypothetical protein CGH72_08375 [Vibrio parahaemolyticus]TOO83639.1 hypothetical protein CGH29_19255 [Vibrio parahaemolyticus]